LGKGKKQKPDEAETIVKENPSPKTTGVVAEFGGEKKKSEGRLRGGRGENSAFKKGEEMIEGITTTARNEKK